MTDTTSSYSFDRAVIITGDLLIGGTPLTLLRLTEAGRDTVERLRNGLPVTEGPLLDRLLDTGMVTRHVGPPPREEPSLVVVTPTIGTPRHPPAPGTVLVDDGSEPPVAEATIRSERNRGPAAARNLGWRRVIDENPAVEFIAFVDADVDTGDERWWAPLMAHFDDPRVGMVAPRIRAGEDGEGMTVTAERTAPALDLGPRGGRVSAGARVSYVPSAAVVVRASALTAVDGYDEDLRTGEDVDLVWRLRDHGWLVVYDPSTELTHEARASAGGWLRQRIGYGRSSAGLAARHGDAVAPWRTSRWGLAVIVALLWSLSSRRPRLLGPAAVIGGAVGAPGLILSRQVDGLDPLRATRVVGQGLARSTTAALAAVRRAWWPLLIPLIPLSRTARRVAVLAAVGARHPARLAADLAHGAGVVLGAIDQGSPRALLPVVPSGRLTHRESTSGASQATSD